ncbi:MAG: DUF4159 domain-containing protein [Planctomycetota bacterium]
MWTARPRSRRASGHAALAVAAIVAGGAPPAPAAAPPAPAAAPPELTADTVTDEHVRRAIDAIVEALYSTRHAERFWDPAAVPPGESKTQQGGHTALVVLSLLEAGQSYQNPRLRDAVASLESIDMEGTYAVAVRAHVWARLPRKFRPNLEADARWLMNSFHDESRCWYYTARQPRRYEDNSIRQYGALGLWEAAKRGLRVEPRFWQMLEDAFLDQQHEDGGWSYQDGEPATGSMTAAGLAVLFITQDFLHAEEAVRLDGPRESRADVARARGLTWMDEHFSATANPGRDTYFYYYLYGVERVGLASGYTQFGGRDWFRHGAAELLNRLCRRDPATGAMSIHERTYGRDTTSRIKPRDLAFALMFLSRGRVPVAINKLRLADDASWNNRPRDVANLTALMRDDLESALNWQIVDLTSDPDRWLDAPILYLASHEPLPWLRDLDVDATRYQREVRAHRAGRATGSLPPETAPPAPPDVPALDALRRYLDLGGLLLAVNEGRGDAFTRSIETAGTLMYPHLSWRALPEDHWAYTIHRAPRGRHPVLRGLSNGVRELIILAPATDWAATFQARAEQSHEHAIVATNIYLYASEMNRPRPRLAEHGPAPVSLPANAPPVTIVRAMYDGRWDAEPLAAAALRTALASERGLDATVIDHPLAGLDELARPPALAIVSGVEPHEFTPAEAEAVRGYVGAGGTILFETAGGRGGFALSAEKMATRLFARPIRSVLRHPIVTGEGIEGAPRLTRVAYRPFALEQFGARDVTPRLRGMRVDGRVALLFSREDCSHALLDQPCWGISGYAPEAARALLGNLAEHAMRERSNPADSGPDDR